MDCILYVLLMNDLPDALETLALVFVDDVKMTTQYVQSTKIPIPIVVAWSYQANLQAQLPLNWAGSTRELIFFPDGFGTHISKSWGLYGQCIFSFC